MKANMTLLKGQLIVSLSLIFFSSSYSQTADPLANAKTKCILQYISGLSSGPDNRVISGQWMNWRGLPNTPASEFDTVITSLYNQTNKWVGIIGTDYVREHFSPYYKAIENLRPVNQPLIDYFNQGGLIAVMLSWKNPWTGGFSGDLTGSNNLLDIVTNGHPANTFFNKELDSIALGFQQLQDSGVTILFRPFHEMNGQWFWWGSKSTTLPVASDFAALWQYTFDYLTTTKNLHNILWYYTPSARESNVSNLAFKTEVFYYPGSNYVDVVGLDVYNDTLDIPNYSSVVSLGKPIGLAEFGPKKQNATNNPFSYDYSTLINQIRTKYPLLCHWISYNHFKAGQTNNWIYYSLCTQNNTTALLNDSWVVTQEEIDYSGCLVTSSTLPIELISFSGTASGKKNILYWVTASEVNNSYFTILKRVDGNNFQIIGTVNGAGNSSHVLNYSYTDENLTEKVNYYLLQQTDYNGQHTFSNTIAINNSSDKFGSIIISPNPFSNEAIFRTDFQMQNATLTVYNSMGQQVRQLVNISGQTIILHRDELPAGIYNVKLTGDNEHAEMKKLVIAD